MLWLRRPPFLRWASGAAIMAVAVAVDVHGRATEMRPFAAADLPAGSEISRALVTWRSVPRGLLALAELEGAAAADDIRKGDPITPSVVTRTRPIPEGWWAVELDLPAGAVTGAPARLVIEDPPLAVDGFVVSVGSASTFDSTLRGLIAVPPDLADQVARAALQGAVGVMVEANHH